jgi:hypothetical protein
VGHLAVIGLLGIILVDLALYSFRKIPVTCSYLPGKTQVHLVVCAAAVLILLVGQSVVWEQEALQNRGMIALTLALLGVVAIATKWRSTALARFEEEGLQFEEEGIPTFRLANWLSFPISEPFGSRLCQDGSSERKSPGSAECESGPFFLGPTFENSPVFNEGSSG